MLKYVDKDSILTIELNENKTHPDSKISYWVVLIKFRPTVDKNGFTDNQQAFATFDTKEEAEDFIKGILGK